MNLKQIKGWCFILGFISGAFIFSAIGYLGEEEINFIDVVLGGLCSFIFIIIVMLQNRGNVK